MLYLDKNDESLFINALGGNLMRGLRVFILCFIISITAFLGAYAIDFYVDIDAVDGNKPGNGLTSTTPVRNIWYILKSGNFTVSPGDVIYIYPSKTNPPTPYDSTVDANGFSEHFPIILDRFSIAGIVNFNMQIGIGDAVVKRFVKNVIYVPVKVWSLTVTDGTQVLKDDGKGKLTGNGSGTINYSTGRIDATFTNPVAFDAPVIAYYETTNLPIINPNYTNANIFEVTNINERDLRIENIKITMAGKSGISAVNPNSMFDGANYYLNIKNCIFEGNVEGGIFGDRANLKIENSIIQRTQSGSGIFATQGKLEIYNCEIFENTYLRGAGIYAAYNNPIIRFSKIHDNYSFNSYDSHGGGIFCFNCSPEISNCDISDNESGDINSLFDFLTCGGGIYCEYKVDQLAINMTNAIIQNNVINNNSAGCGGGIYIKNMTATIKDNQIKNNRAEYVTSNPHHDRALGGAICFDNSGGTIQHNVINGSLADTGAGIYIVNRDVQLSSVIENNSIENNTANSSGGGICILRNFSNVSQAELIDEQAIVTDNIIAYNTSIDGAGIFALDFSTNPKHHTIIKENEIINNTSSHQGGGIFNRDYTPQNYSNPNDILKNGTQILNNRIEANSALEGGGIYGARGLVAKNLITKNIANSESAISSDAYIYNNLIITNENQIGSIIQDKVGICYGKEIVNNTIDGNKIVAIGTSLPQLNNGAIRAKLGCDIVNNIITNTINGFGIVEEDANNSPARVYNNLFFNNKLDSYPTNERIYLNQGSQIISEIPGLHVQAPEAKNNNLDNPLYVSLQAINYALGFDSPAINYGINAPKINLEIAAGNGLEKEFSYVAPYTPLVPNSVKITDGIQNLSDDGNGKLTGNGSGTINYVSGEINIIFENPVTTDYKIMITYDTVLTDYLGNQKTANSVDLGAIEWMATPIPNGISILTESLSSPPWISAALSGITPALFQFLGDTLRITSNNSNICYGMWIRGWDSAQTNQELLYKISANVSTDEANQSIVPEFRIRVNNADAQLGAMLNINSSGNGEAAPISTPRKYDFYYQPVQGTLRSFSSSYLSFEMLNFGPDSPTASLDLSSYNVSIVPMEKVSILFNFVQKYDFSSSAQGWIYNIVSGVPSPDLFWELRHLVFKTYSNKDTFAHYTSPEISVKPGEIVKIEATIGTNVTLQEKVPTIRLRANSSDLQISSMLVITSAGYGEIPPVKDKPKKYTMYLTIPDFAITNAFRISLDVLNIDSYDEAECEVYLENLEVSKAKQPLFN